MPKKWEKGTYRYILTTNKYYWLRNLADELSHIPAYKDLVSIQQIKGNEETDGVPYVIPHEA